MKETKFTSSTKTYRGLSTLFIRNPAAERYGRPFFALFWGPLIANAFVIYMAIWGQRDAPTPTLDQLGAVRVGVVVVLTIVAIATAVYYGFIKRMIYDDMHGRLNAWSSIDTGGQAVFMGCLYIFLALIPIGTVVLATLGIR